MVYLWDLSTGNLLGPPLPHLGDVRRVRFDAEGGSIVSASDDGLARLWQLQQDLRPTELLSRLVAIWCGRQVADHRLVELEPNRQVEEFLALRREHPDWFRCSNNEVDRWNQLVQRLNPNENDQ